MKLPVPQATRNLRQWTGSGQKPVQHRLHRSRKFRPSESRLRISAVFCHGPPVSLRAQSFGPPGVDRTDRRQLQTTDSDHRPTRERQACPAAVSFRGPPECRGKVIGEIIKIVRDPDLPLPHSAAALCGWLFCSRDDFNPDLGAVWEAVGFVEDDDSVLHSAFDCHLTPHQQGLARRYQRPECVGKTTQRRRPVGRTSRQTCSDKRRAGDVADRNLSGARPARRSIRR